MSLVCLPGAKSDHWYVTALDKLWEIKPEDIEEQWMGVMTKRLLTELNRQIAAVEATRIDKKTEQPTPELRERNAKVLASLEQTLERLARLEKHREAMFESKKGRTYASAREEIQRKFDKRASRGGKTRQS
jgi:hypothetical protein